jgi:hypothetical protein
MSENNTLPVRSAIALTTALLGFSAEEGPAFRHAAVG